MKMRYDEKAAAERMRPGEITSAGFFGSDARSLADIIEADEERMRFLGLDFDTVADVLDHLAREGTKGLGEPVSVENGLLIKSDEARGKFPCPYHDGLFHKNSVVVEQVSSGERLTYSDLSIHLLRGHHFCQGMGSPFRLDPDVISRVLGSTLKAENMQ